MIVSMILALVVGAEPGLKAGGRPGPYSFLVSVGKERGTQHCFVCEAADRPMVIVFARTPSEPLGKLVHGLDKALGEHKKAELRAWVTFLAPDAGPLDAKLVSWSKQHATGTVPLGVFEDPLGPPAYLLSRDADVTVFLARGRKVVRSLAFRAGELDAAKVLDAARALVKD